MTGKEKIRKIAGICGVYISLAVVTIMFTIYPLYLHDGYTAVATYKYMFYLNATKILAVLLLISFALMFITEAEERYPVSRIKKAPLLYMMTVLYVLSNVISYLMSEYRNINNTEYGTIPSGPLFGYNGWYFGLVTVVSMCTMAILAGLVFKYNKVVFIPIAAGALITSVLGILNRYDIYPIKMKYARPTLISTFGNINWFCGYLSIAVPVIYGLFLTAEKKIAKAIAYVICFFMTFIIVVNGSDSGVIAYAVMMFVGLILSLRSRDIFKRYILLLGLFGYTCLLITITGKICPGVRNYSGTFDYFLFSFPVSILLTVVSTTAYILINKEKKEELKTSEKWVSIITATVIGIVLVAVFVNGSDFLNYGTFDDSMGHNRMGIYKIALSVFSRFSLKEKLFGAGPDCFYYAMSEHEDLMALSRNLFGKLELTNAHCEILNVLINEGLVGVFSFAGLCISAFITFSRNIKKRPEMVIFILALVSYLTNNLFSFRQVTSTPLLFLLIGIAMSACKGGVNIDKTGHKDYNSIVKR